MLPTAATPTLGTTGPHGLWTTPCHALGGEPMGFKFAFIWDKGDWSEVASSIGFPTWSHNQFPCYRCWTDRADMCLVDPHWATEGLPWRPIDQSDYDVACAACEIQIEVPNRETLAAIRARLFFDRREKGSHGRALRANVQCGPFLLEAGDRLEPSDWTPNTFSFGVQRIFPVIAIFGC